MMRLLCSTLLLLVLLNGCSSTDTAGGSPAKAADAGGDKQRARDLIDQKQYQAAVDILVPLSKSSQNDPQIHAMLGESYWKLGRYEAAVRSYEAALRLDYSDADVHSDFAEMLMEMGKVGRALTEFELAIRSGDRDPLSRYNYGLALYQFGRRDAALAQWQLAYSAEPQNAKYAEAMGIGLTGNNDAEALHYFEQAADLGADGASFHNNFGVLLLKLGRFSDAASHFVLASNADPKNQTYRLNLAVARLKANQYAEAIPVLEELVAAAPNETKYRAYLGRAYYEAGRFKDVIALLEPWLADDAAGATPGRDPGLGGAYDALAMSFRSVGQLEKAAVFMPKALACEPDNPAYLNNYGVILAESGKMAEAKAQWEKVLQIEPDNEVAKQNLSAMER